MAKKEIRKSKRIASRPVSSLAAHAEQAVKDYEQALGHLDKALKMSPGDDRILYIMASTQALKGDREQALTMLQEAIQINPDNRIHAQQDPDFEPLRDDDAFIDLVSAAIQ